MGDGEPLAVDFDSFSKGVSFYSPEHPQKGLCAPAAHQQLDRSISGASTDSGEQQYSSPELSATEQMDKLSPKTSTENNTLGGVDETRPELPNGAHVGKENLSSETGLESLMTSLGQLALAQSGVMNARTSSSWDEQTLSSAMYRLLAQSGNGHHDGSVASQPQVGTTDERMSSHAPRRLAFGSAPAAAQQGSTAHGTFGPYQSWNDGSVPMQGSWVRQNMHSSGSWAANQRRTATFIPPTLLSADQTVIVPKLRQNSPFPKSLQHLVATSKPSSGLQNCDNIHSGSCSNLQPVCVYVVVIIIISSVSVYTICWPMFRAQKINLSQFEPTSSRLVMFCGRPGMTAWKALVVPDGLIWPCAKTVSSIWPTVCRKMEIG